MLNLLRTRPMQPDAVAAFVAAFGREMNAKRGIATTQRAQLQAERTALQRKLEGLYDAIAEGLRTPGLKQKLEELEGRLTEIDVALSAPGPTPVRLHPNLAELYRRKVTGLAATLEDPEIRTEALEAVRALIHQVTVHVGAEGVTLDLVGALTAMLDLAQPGATQGVDVCSVKVVAGVGFEPTTFRL